MKRILTLRQKSLLNNGLLGLAWIIIGGVQFFSSGIISMILVSIFLLISCIALGIPFLLKTEPEDEMGEYNRDRARSTSYTVISLGITICALIYAFKDEWIINFKLILPFLLGGVNLLEFIFFILYEKAGD